METWRCLRRFWYDAAEKLARKKHAKFPLLDESANFRGNFIYLRLRTRYRTFDFGSIVVDSGLHYTHCPSHVKCQSGIRKGNALFNANCFQHALALTLYGPPLYRAKLDDLRFFTILNPSISYELPTLTNSLQQDSNKFANRTSRTLYFINYLGILFNRKITKP